MKRISSFFGRGSSSQSKEPSSKTTNDTKEKDKDKDKPVKNSVLERLASQPFRLIVAGPRGSGATSLVTKVFGVGLGEKAEHEGEEEEVLSDVPLDDAASSGTATTATATTPTPPEKQSKKAVFVKASRWPNIDDDAKVDAAWIVVAGLPDPETLEAVNSIKALGVPLVAVLSKSDLVAVQEADAAEQMLKGLGCVVVRVSNKPDPTCSDCASKAYKQHVPESNFNGWFCSNSTCDLSKTAFKLDTSPPSPTHPLHTFIQSTKQVILAKNPITITDTKPESPDTTTTTPPTKQTTKPSKDALASNRRFQIAQLIDTSAKREYAKIVVITSTLVSAGLGANPIPFIDAPLVVTSQYTELTGVCQVYGLENRSTYWSLFKNVLATPLAGMFGADLLKMIPGFGTVAGGVVDVVISVTLSLALGVAVGRICEQAIVGRRDGFFVLEDGGDGDEGEGKGKGKGRPVFVLDTEVSKVFKEVYAGSKEAIREMLVSGKLNKEGLMGIIEQGQKGDGNGEVVEEGEQEELERMASEMMEEVVKTSETKADAKEQ